jgi:hypothetical protein
VSRWRISRNILRLTRTMTNAKKGSERKNSHATQSPRTAFMTPCMKKNSDENGNDDESHDLAEHDVSWAGSGHDVTIA